MPSLTNVSTSEILQICWIHNETDKWLSYKLRNFVENRGTVRTHVDTYVPVAECKTKIYRCEIFCQFPKWEWSLRERQLDGGYRVRLNFISWAYVCLCTRDTRTPNINGSDVYASQIQSHNQALAGGHYRRRRAKRVSKWRILFGNNCFLPHGVGPYTCLPWRS